MAEYTTNAPPQNPTTNYVATDTLQSVRAISDKNGNIISRRDFMPFGEEIYVNTAARTANDKYTSGQDAVRQRFTGYEKDAETDLDFAEARYYNNRHGRFTAVDPLIASGKSANPQTFNRYVYVMNSPLIFSDEDGMQAGSRMYVRGSEGHLHFKISATRPSGFRVFNGSREVISDGYRYQVNGSSNGGSIIGIGPVNRATKLPSQGISTSHHKPKPFVNTALLNDLGNRAPAMLKLAAIGEGVTGGLVACVVGCAAVATAATATATSAGTAGVALAEGTGAVLSNPLGQRTAAFAGGAGIGYMSSMLDPYSGGGGSNLRSQIIAEASRFGSGQCDSCASGLQQLITSNGGSGEVLTVSTPFAQTTRTMELFSDAAGVSVGTNGWHQGVLYEGFVYDNIHPQGLPYQQWINNFQYRDPATGMATTAPVTGRRSF